MNILLGITGSIAAYKTPWLVRDLRRAGHDVRVVMTPSATRFASPLALQAVSLHDVIVDAFDPTIQDGGSWHVHLAHWAHLMLIAPCSATTLARLATGLTDTAVSLVAASLPSTTPLLVAPAMDADMWNLASTKRNVDNILADGVIVIPPATGDLASGLVGEGRLPELSAIIALVQTHRGTSEESTFQSLAARTEGIEAHTEGIEAHTEGIDAHRKGAQSLRGKHVVVTAGPTHEAIDDVRFVSNASSGLMGYALAEAARDRGAIVTLVSGPVALPVPHAIAVQHVKSAEQMYDAVMNCRNVDVYVMAAAVADFTPVSRIEGKMKKEQTLAEGTLTIEFKKTKDILAAVGSNKHDGQIVVGFALETTNLVTHAQDKLIRKHADIIVANQAGVHRSGFGTAENTITILSHSQGPLAYPPMNKRACAEVILDAVLLVHDKHTKGDQQ